MHITWQFDCFVSLATAHVRFVSVCEHFVSTTGTANAAIIHLNCIYRNYDHRAFFNQFLINIKAKHTTSPPHIVSVVRRDRMIENWKTNSLNIHLSWNTESIRSSRNRK